MKLDETYSRDDFITFLKEFLPDFQRDIRDLSLPRGIQSIQKGSYLGSSQKLDLEIFELEHDASNEKRVGLATDGFRVMREGASFQALIAYTSKSGGWRLSLMTATPEIKEGGKVVTKLSNPRRFSFALGPKAKVVTPTKFLLQKGQVSDLEDLKSRFSVEVVNKEFYTNIAHLYTELVGGIRGEGRGAQTFPGILKLPSVAQHSEEMQQFAVRLIGRLVFCWFLREKKNEAGQSLIPPELLSFEAARSNRDYYHNFMEPLFFEVLNRQMDSRREQYSKGHYATTPYLNGGLFSPQNDDFYSSNEGKQAVYHNTVTVPDEWICRFFEILEQYNFTVDENTSVDVDLSIDPEMLGRIFENLLAEINPETGATARKGTGSFYTPRQIVDYMADQSLLAYLEQKTAIARPKLQALVSYDLDDDAEHPLNADEQQKIVDALGSLTILDPACGSGAFPIGALQKVVYMLQQIDPEAQLWFQQQISNAPPEVKRLIEREFKHRNFDYIRKLGVIRQSIYGVDIQPIATEIARLRCFLTLIVDERVDDTQPNRGIEPLPNLDFKFVTANSLIKLPVARTGQINLFDDQDGIDELKAIRNEYFSASASERDQIKYRFAQVQKSMFQKMISGGGFAELTHKLSAWDPFSHKVTDWFESEWMFGIEGFDIVIANPPYVDSEEMTRSDAENRAIYNARFDSAKGNWDLFVVFVELGLSLLNEHGFITYIVPNKLIGARYADTLRGLMLDKNILELRDYSKIKVFRDVSVYPIIFLLQNAPTHEDVEVRRMATAEEALFSNKIPASVFYRDTNWDRYFSNDPASLDLIIKITDSGERLDSYFPTITSAATVGEAYALKDILVDGNSEQLAMAHKKLINTGTVDPYLSLWGVKRTQYIKAAYDKPVVLDDDLQAKFPRRYAQAASTKIIIGGMTKELECYLDEGSYLAGKSTTIIQDNPSSKLGIKPLLALLNSKLVSYWFKHYFSFLALGGGFIRISGHEIKQIPIPPISETIQEQLSNMVDNVKSNNNAVQNQIDDLVYKLYGLTNQEISLINGAKEAKEKALVEAAE